jgi:hypothetical protein
LPGYRLNSQFRAGNNSSIVKCTAGKSSLWLWIPPGQGFFIFSFLFSLFFYFCFLFFILYFFILFHFTAELARENNGELGMRGTRECERETRC